MLSHILRTLASGGATPAPSSIQYIGRSTARAASGSASVTCTVPAGAIAGDLLIAFINETANMYLLPVTHPTGWTETFDSNGKSCSNLASYDGTTTTYTFTKTGTNATLTRPQVVIMAFRNAAFKVQGLISTSTKPTVAPSINVDSANSVVIAYFSGQATTDAFTTPSGFTEVIDTGFGAALSYKTGVPSGATGTVTSTPSAGSARGFLVSLGPPVTTGVVASVTGSAVSSLALPSGLQPNDIVIYAGGRGVSSSTLPTTPTGYTDFGTGVGNPPNVTRKVSYKVMGPTPDTTISGLDNGTRSVHVVVVLRGYTGTPAAVTAAIVAGDPNPPAITGVPSGAIVLAFGFIDNTAIGAPSGYEMVSWNNGTDTAVGIAYTLNSPGGTIDPPAFIGNASDSGAFTSYVSL